MKIGDKDYKEIIVTDSNGGLLVSITEDNIIVSDDCNIVCIPDVCIPDESKEIRGYTRIVVETDEDNPKTIAEITKELITPADGYRVRLTPEYD